MADHPPDRVRVGVYGCGRFANRRRIPNLLSIPGVEIVAFCDSSREALGATQARVSGATAYDDPGLAQDRAFIEAVRTGDGSGLASDYADGLKTLAPILAGWASSKREGQTIYLDDYLRGD